ncbi:MAG: PTS sugar transporter subunit IIA, partial [Coprobacillus cateniformis]
FSGIVTSELIFHKIQKAIPAQDTLEITTYHALKKRDLRKIDLIISTIDLDIEDIPIIKVSALISNSDLKKITEKYANFFYKDDYEREIEHFQYLKQYIEEKMIFWDMEFKNKDECLKFVMEKLYSAGYVKEGFEKSILEREKIGTTALDSGVAIPHASIEYTRETKIVIVNLKHKILWNDKKIDVVALININQKDKANVRNLLGELYQFIRERKDVEKYFKMNTKDEFIK